ncbi:helix-turn-helix domain-containing protein [Amycolatopsis sp. NPDC098790]|uniref:helix-turn-helix domain-containing protein n=1 Tax=Amycolatopsis sp. NPDC098790 TaxID=3363939 RepID=UPI0037FC59A6
MYEEAAPPRRLAGVARCVWRSASAGPKRIVPDGCLDLVVGDGGVFVAGPDTASWSSVTRPGAVLRGVRFKPGHAPAVLGVAADELRDRRVSLGELWGRSGEELAERLLAGEVSPAGAVESRLAAVEVESEDWAVAELIEKLDAGAARVADAAACLARGDAGPAQTGAQSRAATRLEEPSAVSERRLRRRFVQAVGYGPATYLRVARFQRAVALAPRLSGLAALAAAAGYSDQAHLSRDCRALTGLTPRHYFRPSSTVDPTRRDRLRSA